METWRAQGKGSKDEVADGERGGGVDLRACESKWLQQLSLTQLFSEGHDHSSTMHHAVSTVVLPPDTP